MYPPDSSEQSTVTFLLQDLHGLVGQSGTGALEGVEPGIQVDEAELEVQRRGKGFKDPSASLYCKFPALYGVPLGGNYHCIPE